jgi:hypothetical protein
VRPDWEGPRLRHWPLQEDRWTLRYLWLSDLRALEELSTYYHTSTEGSTNPAAIAPSPPDMMGYSAC